MRISCPAALRKSICDALEDEEIEGEIKRLYYDVAKERKDPFDLWVHNMRQHGSWGGTTTALFVCYMFGINICIVTNGEETFAILSSRGPLPRCFVVCDIDSRVSVLCYVLVIAQCSFLGCMVLSPIDRRVSFFHVSRSCPRLIAAFRSHVCICLAYEPRTLMASLRLVGWQRRQCCYGQGGHRDPRVDPR